MAEEPSQRPVTPISIGNVIRDILLHSEEVTAITGDIFPVLSDDPKTMPYIAYRLDGMQVNSYTNMQAQCDASIAVDCYCADFDQSVELAEAVIRALNFARGLGGNRCRISDARAGWAGDAYVQMLRFTLKTMI